MHRLILAAAAGQWVDHIDGDGLNNRRANLRICDPNQNAANSRRVPNTIGYRGVWRTIYGRYYASITSKGRAVRLGSFSTAIEAAVAYDEAAKELHGEFATLNFPEGAP
jgi:hypothetical protein